jgi:predicted GH43/DUF377 family glycosyl hydrolase
MTDPEHSQLEKGKLLLRRKRIAAIAAMLFFRIVVATAQDIPKAHQAEPRSRERSRIVFNKLKGAGAGGSVMDIGEPGAFDTWATCPSVLFDGKLYRMWYSSMYHSKDGPRGIGLATSVDGVNWKRTNDGRPVFSVGPKGAFDSAQILSPEVRFDGRIYLMWYTGIDGSIDAKGFELERIGLATSEDGVHWTRANGGKPVLDLGPQGSYDDVQVAYPSVIRDGSSYRMWYSAYAGNYNHTIAVARSRDGIHWERENEGRPVNGLSPAIAYAPGVIRIGRKLLMLYTGGYVTRRPWGIFAAVSEDGMNWRMVNEGEPFVSHGTENDFDKDNQSHPSVLSVKGRLRVWYSGFNRGPAGKDPLVIKIGLAEAVQLKIH